jgi:Glycosyl transferase family 2
MQAAPKDSGRVLCRTLGGFADAASGLTLLDAVAWADNGAQEIRLFFASGTRPDAFLTAAQDGCAAVRELREVSGGVMMAARAAALPARIALSGTAAPLTVAPAIAEWDLMAGRNVCLALRNAESADTIADWLRYHATVHGMTGAVIVDRAKDGHADLAAHIAASTADLPDLCVILVASPLPLGRPDTGPEAHPFLAPDAPGKDRMERPAPDPWRAPLGQGLIYEIAKWRFLAKARAVLTLDVSDLLAPPSDQGNTAFDLCRTARNGVILLAGRRIYPWRVRKGQPERFGDHICRQFDSRRGIARWGVAPDVAGLENTWRGVRVAFARPDDGVIVPFWRAMAVRIPGHKTSELVPKTSLVEDPALIDLAVRQFAHKPVYARVSDYDDPVPAAATARTCIVTTMKNEGPFILEWLAYHRAIGVQDFLIYTNDCTDGTDTMLDLLQSKGFVQHRQNPFRESGLKPQHAALQAAEGEPLIARADWAICMDVDEFINIRIGDGTLPALFAAMEAALPGANMIALTWRLFGNADVHAYEDRFLIDQFTMAAPEMVRKPHQAWGFKTLFRTIDIYKKLGVHRPKGLRPDLWDQVRWLNGSGREMPREMFRNGWRSTTDTYGYDWVSLNHYAVRSAESFLVKRDRGRVNHTDRDQGLNYWFRMNFNMVEDRSIQRMIPLARAEYDRLLADPAIRAAHDAAVAAHRAKIAELRARPDQAAFYAELTGPRMQALSRILHVFGSSVFDAGPQVIPPDLHERALPEGFYFTVGSEADAAADARAEATAGTA